ncbi:unnamed protein product [Protopolystoma xenopodis]|uniref:Major facilitator superfamily (MFS) profile domain-containing protein n=1 Tax=Protopolystoma xenopodis TaxID=117903 RepID=A0A448XJH6_9PLAT|nr:unnamed protein product [Protopolystoma xenopodis]
MSAYIWISFSPVADHTLKFYNTDEDIVNWLSAVFIITTIVFGLPAIFIVDYFGVRVVIIFSSFFLFICGIFRVITSSFLPFHSNNIKIALLFVGQISASFSQPLLMFLPTKLAFVWFPDRQRTIANTIGSLGNPLGVLLGSGLVPIIVQSFEDIPLLNWITFSITCVGPFLALITIFHDRPKIPPSIAAYIVEEKRSAYSHSGFSFTRTIRIYGEYILQALRVPGFIILWISFSTALAYFTVFSALAQQILCAKGYSDKFAGLVGSLMIICGLIGAAISAIIMDRTGKLKEMIKICYCLAILGEAGLSTLLFIPKMAAGILVFSCWLGTFGFAQYSVILEAAAEATYPVPESITTGLLIVGSQILSLVFLPMLQAVSPYLDESSFEAFSPTCGQASHPKVCSIYSICYYELGF